MTGEPAAWPRIGLGTYGLQGEQASEAVRTALEAGYRLLDTAVAYGNEAAVAAGLRRSGIPREEVLVQTKVPGPEHLRARDCVAASLDRMGLEHVDVALIHWPNPRRDQYVQAWEGLLAAQAEGLVSRIGVSNFHAPHIARIVAATGVAPAVDQVERHPYFAQADLMAAPELAGVCVQAWSPLGRGTDLLGHPVVQRVAGGAGARPAQVVLAWHLATGALPLPKSGSPQRQRENLAALDVVLSPADVAGLSALARPDGRRKAEQDPERFEDW